MKIFKAFRTGFGKVFRSKRYIFLVYLINFAAAVVFALILKDAIQESLGSTAAADKLVENFDGYWYESFSAGAGGLSSTFSPSVEHIGAIFDGLDVFLTGNLWYEYLSIVIVGFVYLLLWTFFSAGFIALYAEEFERPPFFHRAARFFPRFFILAIISGVLYFLIFYYLLDWMTVKANEITRETIDERFHFGYTVIKYLIIWILVWIVNIIFDYSKIIIVLQDHKNFLIAPFKAFFKAIAVIFSHIRRTFGLYFLLGIFWIILMLLYWLVSVFASDTSWLAEIIPEAGASLWFPIICAFVVGQFYVISRICMRCLFFAGQTALCSSLIQQKVKTTIGPKKYGVKQEMKPPAPPDVPAPPDIPKPSVPPDAPKVQ